MLRLISTVVLMLALGLSALASELPTKGFVTTTGTPFEANQANAAADILGAPRPDPHAKEYFPAHTGWATVVAVVPPAQWIRKYRALVKAARAQGVDQDLRHVNDMVWLVEIEGSDRVRMWMTSGAIYIPCLGGDLSNGGIKPPTKQCHR